MHTFLAIGSIALFLPLYYKYCKSTPLLLEALFSFNNSPISGLVLFFSGAINVLLIYNTLVALKIKIPSQIPNVHPKNVRLSYLVGGLFAVLAFGNVVYMIQYEMQAVGHGTYLPNGPMIGYVKGFNLTQWLMIIVAFFCNREVLVSIWCIVELNSRVWQQNNYFRIET
jgi:hypothetical protein